MEKSDNLKFLTIVMTGVFLLLAIRTSYLDYAENMASSGDGVVCILNGLGLFTMFEAPYILITYVVAPMIADAMPGMWKAGENIFKKMTSIPTSFNLDFLSFYRIGLRKKHHNKKCKSNLIELSNEIVSYITETFKDILLDEQIDKLLNNFRRLNLAGPFDVIEKIKLPEGITQFDLWNLTWNIVARIYDKEDCKMKMRDVGAMLVKHSFPLTVTYALSTIRSKLKYFEDPDNYSLPPIEKGLPLIPHHFKLLPAKAENA